MTIMDLTQKDYDERVNRRAAGQATDEDLRLIKHYEDEGFSTREDSTGKREQAAADDTTNSGADNDGVVRSETGSGADVKPVSKLTARGNAKP